MRYEVGVSYLAVSTASSTPLDAKRRALAGLADASDALLAKVRAERLRHAHGGGGLALAEGGWGDASHHNWSASCTN
jgi:hypothetical protein